MGVGPSKCGLQRRRRRGSDRPNRTGNEGELRGNLGGGEVVAPPVGTGGSEDDECASRWSDLPPELAGMVFCRLLSHGDRHSFRAVCSDWRLAARQQRTMAPSSLPPSLPWLGLDRRTYQSLPDGEVHRFPDGPGITVCRGSFDGWLLYYRNGYHEISSCFLWNPFSGDTLELPSHCDCPFNPLPYFHEANIRKIVVCSPDLVAALVEGGWLLLHRLDMHSSWSVGNSANWCHDIAFYHGKLYSITDIGELFVHEVFTGTDRGGDGIGTGNRRARVAVLSVPVIDTWPPTEHLGTDEYHRRRFTSYLVVSLTGKLLLVRWSLPSHDERFADLSKAITVRVFEADLEMHRWTEVMDLGDDQATTSCSKALRLPPPDNGHGFLRGNRVFIVGSELRKHRYESCCVHDMNNGRFSAVSFNRWRAGQAQSSSMAKGASRLSEPDTIRVEETLRAEWFFPSEL